MKINSFQKLFKITSLGEISAKDVVLETLRRYDVDGGRGKIIEYYGSGLQHLSAMKRHVIANMGTEMGANGLAD